MRLCGVGRARAGEDEGKEQGATRRRGLPVALSWVKEEIGPGTKTGGWTWCNGWW